MTEIEALVTIRKAGKVPACVTLWLDDYLEQKRGARWFEVSLGGAVLQPEIHITGDILMLDLRCLVGLDVQIFTRRYTSRAAQLFDAVKAIPANSAMLRFGSDDDFGVLLWTRGGGDGEISDWQAVQHWCHAQRHVRASA